MVLRKSETVAFRVEKETMERIKRVAMRERAGNVSEFLRAKIAQIVQENGKGESGESLKTV